MTSQNLTSTSSWEPVLRRARREALLWRVGLHAWLAVLTLPILLGFAWMAIYAFTPAAAKAASAIDGVLTATVFAAVAVIVSAMLRRAYPRRATAATLLTVGFALAAFIAVRHESLSVDNFALLWDRGALIRSRSPGLGGDLFPSIWQAASNSVLLATFSALAVVITATCAGYIISRHSFPGRGQIFSLLLLLHAFPVVTLLVPIFLQMNALGLTDSLFAVLLVICALELPFAVFAMKTFFDAVPWSIEMSAMADGASRTGAFFRILLPQVKGGMLAVGFFAFLRGWDEYIFVQSLIYSKDNWTMSQFIFFASDDFAGTIDYGIVFAAGLIYLLPAVALYIMASRHVDRVSLGGTKG